MKYPLYSNFIIRASFGWGGNEAPRRFVAEKGSLQLGEREGGNSWMDVRTK